MEDLFHRDPNGSVRFLKSVNLLNDLAVLILFVVTQRPHVRRVHSRQRINGFDDLYPPIYTRISGHVH